jgi:hypothetical protein
MTDPQPHTCPTAPLTTLAAHHAACDTESFAQHVAALLTAPQPVLLDLSCDHGTTINLTAHPYEGERP